MYMYVGIIICSVVSMSSTWQVIARKYYDCTCLEMYFTKNVVCQVFDLKFWISTYLKIAHKHLVHINKVIQYVVCVRSSVCLNLCMHVCMYIHVCVYVYSTCVYMCVHVCVHVYIHV